MAGNKMKTAFFCQSCGYESSKWMGQCPGCNGDNSVLIDEHLFNGIKAFASAAVELADSPLYVVDLEELTAQYLGARMEETVASIYRKCDLELDWSGEKASFLKMGYDLDRVLASHPNLRLENWIGFARAWGTTPELADYYEHNAKRLITIWGPPVDDYSARIWSGLIRDYYLPRWSNWFDAKAEDNDFDFPSWEEDWVMNSKGVSPLEPFEDPVATCLNLIENN